MSFQLKVICLVETLTLEAARDENTSKSMVVSPLLPESTLSRSGSMNTGYTLSRWKRMSLSLTMSLTLARLETCVVMTEVLNMGVGQAGQKEKGYGCTCAPGGRSYRSPAPPLSDYLVILHSIG